MPITPDTFKPYGDHDEFVDAETIMTAEVDGVKYLTDRHLLIRADLVSPQPDSDHMFKMRPADTEAVTGFIQKIMSAEPIPEPNPAKKLAPVYVADLEGTGLTLAPSASVWLIRQDGVTVGCIAPIQKLSDSFDGVLPGELLPVHHAVYKAVGPSAWDRWHGWNAAVEAVAIVKAAS